MATETAVATPMDLSKFETVEVNRMVLEDIIRKSEQGTKEKRFTLTPKDLAEAKEYAELITRTAMCPEAYQGKAEEATVAIMMGADLGFSPLQSLQVIAVINGRPSIWGDAALALCMASGLMEDFKELSGSDAMTAGEGHCVAKRKGMASPADVKFTVEDAKTAGLWGKTGKNGYPTPWVLYPGRMLQMRARGFALRDKFPDVLRGLVTVEESMDYQTGPLTTAAIEETVLKAPKRKVESEPLLVIDEGKPSSGAGNAPVSKTTVTTPPAEAKPATPAKGVWEGTLSKVEPISYAMKDQKTKKPTGKTGTWFKFHGSDGQTFATFSESHAEIASTGVATESKLRITWEKSNGKDNLKVVSVEPILAQQPAEEDLPFEPGSNG